MSTRRIMRVADVAAYLGQSEAWCRGLLADGTIPGARKVRGRWLIARDDVDRWIDAGRPARDLADTVPYAPPPRFISRTVDRDAA